MRKLKLLVAVCALWLSATTASAAVWIETDLTKQFIGLTDSKNWSSGTSTGVGYATWAAPQVTVAGKKYYMVENYVEGQEVKLATGDVMFQTVTGLAEGTYKIELYGSAALTEGRSNMTTDFTEGDETSLKAVYLYAETSEGTVKQYIPCLIEDNFNDRGGEESIPTATLEGIQVGGDGTIKIGIYKEIGLTNWHIIQLKSVIATVDAEPLYQNALKNANDALEKKMASAYRNAISNAIDTYGEGKVAQNADAYLAAVKALDDAVEAAQKSIKSYEMIENGSVPTDKLDGWTCTTFIDGQDIRFQVNTWSNEGVSDGSNMLTPFIENWTPKGNILGVGEFSYTMEGLEPGEVYYASGLIRSYNEANSDAPNGPDFFVNDKEDNLSAAGTTFTYNNMSGIFATLGAIGTVGADGKLTIGARIAADANYNWVAFKDVAIQSPDVALQKALEKAEELSWNLNSGAAQNLLQQVLNQYQGKTYSTADEYESVIGTINRAMDEAKQIDNKYAQLQSAYETATAVIAQVASSGQQSSFQEEIDGYLTDYNTAEDYDTAIEQINTVKANAQALVNKQNDLQKAIENAEGLYESITFQSTLDELSGVVSMYDGAAFDTVEEYDEAIGVINDAINKAKADNAMATSCASLIERAKALCDEPSDNASALTTFRSSVTTAENNYYNAASADDIATVYEDLNNAIATYISSVREINLTCLLPNADVTEFWTGDDNGGVDGDNSNHAAWGVQPEGWYNEQNGGNFQVMTNQEMGPGGEVFMEYWSGTAASNGFVLCQKVTLPAGTYQITARTGLLQYDGNGETANVTFSANDVDGTMIPFGPLSDSEVEFVQDADEPVEVRIGLKAQTGNNARWMAINNITLKKIPGASYEFDENEAMDVKNVAGDVTIKRTIIPGIWNTFSVPFQVNAEETKAAFGDDVEIAEYSETVVEEDATCSVINFVKMETPAIVANKPVLIKTSTAGSEYSFNGRMIAASEAVVAGTNYDFVGNYNGEIGIDEGSYILSNNQLRRSVGRSTLLGMRAYIYQKNAAARLANVYIDGVQISEGEATGIDTVANAAADGRIYNLNGQQVKTAQKGIFIQEGKKIVVK